MRLQASEVWPVQTEMRGSVTYTPGSADFVENEEFQCLDIFLILK